jgi:hypothetical protein
MKTLERLGRGRLPDGTSLLKKEVIKEVEALGHELYRELFPSELRHAYGEFRDRIKTLLIVSEELWIPWELVKPFESREGEVLFDDDFLCCQFELTRWLTGEGMPSAEIQVPRIVSIESGSPPGYKPLLDLPKERQFLTALAQRHPDIERLIVSDATYAEVEQVLQDGGNGILHFAGHGWFDAEIPNESTFYLADRSFRPRDLHGVIESQLQRDRPLVFLNIGNSISAWVSRWVSGGSCGGLIGPQWFIDDHSSFLFARYFYENLEQGETLGRAALATRLRIREEMPRSTAWLVYAVYAHPNARLRLGTDSTP